MLAIALFETRVAPRFDFAPAFRLVEEKAGQTQAVDVAAQDWRADERAMRLAERGVDVLICGAIDRQSAEQLVRQGIRVLDWVSGEADDALSAFQSGELRSHHRLGPGGRSRGCWRIQRRCRGGGRQGGGGGRGRRGGCS